MKSILKPVLTGLVTALIIVIVMLKITMNFQVILFFGAIMFFATGFYNSKNKRHSFATALLIIAVYSALFILFVLEQLPELWYFIPIYFASAIFGILFKMNKRKISISLTLLTTVMILLALIKIPNDLENRLTEERFDRLPEFTIEQVDGKSVASKDLVGKIVILDFFGTWCKPCILELKELAEIKESFNDEEVEFFVINADLGGDTPEKFNSFISKNDYEFKYAYDQDSKIFKQLKLAHLGLPTLLIIDKEQNIRLQHVGYNPAETKFNAHMIETITNLLSE